MPETSLSTTVRQKPGGIAVIDIQGEITGFAEDVLMAAYSEATNGATRAVVFNFSGLDYMNSSGIGLLVTMLIRAQRQKQRLLAFGLNDHYQQIFELTRLNEAIAIHVDEQQALASLVPAGR